MAPVIEAATPQLPDLGYSISHQKVELDIDLRSRSLKGRTEITVNPHSQDLKRVKLNCRQAELTRLTMNGKQCSGVAYEDPYSRAKLPFKAGVQQYHLLQQRLEGQSKNPPEEELAISLPKNVKIDELDPFSEEAQNILLSKPSGVNNKRDYVDGSIADPAQNSRMAVEQTARFTPLVLVIDYVIKKIRDGMQFVGWEEEDFRYPHAYTTNSLIPGSACCLFPCMDDLTSRCTWEISIKCQKTVGDALRQPSKMNSQLQVNGTRGNSNGFGGSSSHRRADDRSNDFTEEDKALDLTVICTGDMTDEVNSCYSRETMFILTAIDYTCARPYKEDYIIQLPDSYLSAAYRLCYRPFRAR